MNTIVQWATILSPIIAVLLAWWTSRRGARDTEKLVNSIRKLTEIQFELTQIQIEKEMLEAHALFSQATRRENSENHKGYMSYQIGGFMDSLQAHEDRKKDISERREFELNRLKELQKISARLESMKHQFIDK